MAVVLMTVMLPKSDFMIFIIDDDKAVRRGISMLLESGGYLVETFENIETFLKSVKISEPSCILLDIFLNGESSLELHKEISERFVNFPIIYMTGYGDIPMSVQALKKGALNFLQKPIDELPLFKAVEEALGRSQNLVTMQNEKNEINHLVKSLTPREFEIFCLVIKGLLNKQIASQLNIAEHTVKLHRGKITEKLRVKSVPDMVYMAEKLDIK
jgi:FixJ family two-component response regulator